MSAIFDFAAEYDLSAALTELRVAIRLRDGRGRNEDCSPCPTQINIVSIAAMHTPLPQWVISTDPNRPRARAYVCTTPESYRNLADYWRSMMRLTSRSKSKSEVSGQSGHCSARLLAALRPSRPGEFHPEPLTDPDLTLSRHPARATARRLPPSIEYRVPPVAG